MRGKRDKLHLKKESTKVNWKQIKSENKVIKEIDRKLNLINNN